MHLASLNICCSFVLPEFDIFSFYKLCHQQEYWHPFISEPFPHECLRHYPHAKLCTSTSWQVQDAATCRLPCISMAVHVQIMSSVQRGIQQAYHFIETYDIVICPSGCCHCRCFGIYSGCKPQILGKLKAIWAKRHHLELFLSCLNIVISLFCRYAE